MVVVLCVSFTLRHGTEGMREKCGCRKRGENVFRRLSYRTVLRNKMAHYDVDGLHAVVQEGKAEGCSKDEHAGVNFGGCVPQRTVFFFENVFRNGLVNEAVAM